MINKTLKTFIIVSILVIGGVLTPSYTFAEPPPVQDEAVDIPEYDGAIVDFESLITNAYRLLLPIAIGVFGIPIVILAGYKIMTSQGDPSKTKSGKEDMTAAVSGLLFLLLALSILRIILSNFLGQ